MGFKERIDKSEKTLNLFVGWCKENNISYAYSGYEKLKQSREFKNNMQKLDSVTAQRIRYFPDLIIASKKAWLIEIKNSEFIEKDAYETYMDLSSIGYNVAIVDIYENQLLFIDIVNLKIKNTKRDPLKALVNKDLIPFKDEWFYPREWLNEDSPYYNPESYKKWKEKSGGSDTPFGVIDFENSEKVILIKEIEKIDKDNSNFLKKKS